MSPVRYELGFYFSEDGILRSYRREKLKCYKAIIGGHRSGDVKRFL
jgi:hypothetical protein